MAETEKERDTGEITLPEEDSHFERVSKVIMRISLVLLILFAVFILYIIYLCIFGTTPTKYNGFSKRRIAEMEKIFSISVSEDVELIEYVNEPAYWLDNDSHTLTLKVDDYVAFFINNIRHKIYFQKTSYAPPERMDNFGYFFNDSTDHRLEIKNSDYDVDGYIYKDPDDDRYTIELVYIY